MKLKTLRIVNFRCCRDLRLDIGFMHALVGSNNSGKSTILKALDFLFNPSTSKINEECFWAKDTSLPIRVEGLSVRLGCGVAFALAPRWRSDMETVNREEIDSTVIGLVIGVLTLGACMAIIEWVQRHVALAVALAVICVILLTVVYAVARHRGALVDWIIALPYRYTDSSRSPWKPALPRLA